MTISRARTYQIGRRATDNARRNSAAFSAMTWAEKQTGKTPAELDLEQRRLRAEFLERDAQRRAA